MLIPQLNSIISNVDRIHAELPYLGGRLPIRQIVDLYPGLDLVPNDRLPNGVNAAMLRQRGIARILYRRSIATARQRFAVAQQIGHAFLHAGHMPGFGLRPSKRLSGELRGRQAKFFASELLVPVWALELALPESVTSELPYAKIDRELLRRLAVHFGVSQAVIRIRVEAYRQVRRTQAGRAPAAHSS